LSVFTRIGAMTENKKPFRKYLIAFWSLYALGVLGVVILFTLIAKGDLGFMPTFEELENTEPALASEVYTHDGEVLRKFFKENRTYVRFEDLSPNIVNALVATEDVRFYQHSGIDLRGLFRVAKGILTGNESAGGGSTISQQVAKMLFPRERYENKLDFVIRKFREWVIAVKLERSFTKEEILTMYLNKFDFLNLAVGVKSAAQIYFNTTPDSLNVDEAATLVGMAKNPSLFNPVRRPDMVLGRRNVVLSQMTKYGYLTPAAYDTLKTKSLDLKYKREDFKSGSGTYFTEYLRVIMTASKPDRSNYASWQDEKFKEDSIEWETNPLYGWCSKNLKPDGTNYNIYNDGLKIYTTIDSHMQRDAEQSVVEHLSTDLQPTFFSKLKELKHPPFSDDLSVSQIDDILDREIRKSERYRVLHERGLNFKEIKENFNKPVEMNVFSWKGEVDTTMTPLDSIKYYLSYLRSSMMTMDVKTGAVRAYVGGPNYKYFMYDMVTGGKRQVGSTVKPFLYTLAMQNGYSPCTLVPNTEQTFYLPDGTTWTAKNSSSEREGQMVTLKWGLANSVNQISAWIMKKFNPQAMKNVMRKMGIISPIDAVPSMFLGTSDISLYEMVGAFGTFGNHGVYTKPYFVDRIEDKDGNVLARFTPQQHEAIDQKTAYLMLNLMEGVVNEGTSQRLRWHPVYGHLTADIAGKTGTTQNQSDGWFIGITPELVTGVWTGADLRSIHFKGIHFGQGANMALPIYGRFMNKLYSDSTLNLSQDTKFDRPPNFNINLDCDEVNKKNSQKNQTTTQDDFF